MHSLILDTFKYLFTLSKYCPDYLCQNAGILELLMNKIILNRTFGSGNTHKLTRIQSNDENNLVAIACQLFLLLSTDENEPITAGSDAKKYMEFKNKKVEQCLR